MRPILDSPVSILATSMVALTHLSIINPQPCLAQTNCTQCPSGLIAWWPGDGNATDLTGVNQGTLLGGTGFAPGLVDQAFAFDGINAFVEVSDSPLLNLNDGLTVVAWIKPLIPLSQQPRWPRLASKQDWRNWGQSNVAPGWTLYANGSESEWAGLIGFAVQDTSGNGAHASTTTPDLTPTTVWSLVAGTYDGASGVIRFYLNGVLQQETDTPGLGSTVANVPLYIGATSPGWDLFDGLIDEVAIFDRALSSGEIVGIYTAGPAGMCKDAWPPTILASPADQYLLLGGNATFTVAASGTPPLSYQWLFNGVNLADHGRVNGATSSNLTIASVQAGDAGDYAVVVSNTFGSVTSAVAQLGRPVSTAWGAGADVEMREQSNGGFDTVAMNTRTSSSGDRNEIIGLRFDLSGYTLADLTNVSLLLTSFRDDQYTRVVDLYGVGNGTTGGSGSFTTENWDETALTAFGDLPGLLVTDSNYLSQSISLGRVSQLGQITVSGAAEGATQVFNDPSLTTFVQTYAGSDRVTFLLAAANNSRGQFRVASKEATNLATAGLFTGPAGTFAPTLSFSFSTPCTNCPPVILAQPENLKLNVGDTAQFLIMAESLLLIDYQWLFNGVLIPGETNATLVLPDVQPAQAGTYAVTVSTLLGSVTSSNATLLVNEYPLADASATPTLVISPNGANANVVLDGSRSSDPESDRLNCQWMLSSTPIATGMVAVVSLPVGAHAIDLIVDDGMAQDTDTVTVTILTTAQAVEGLITLVNESDLRHKRPLLASLEAALASIERGNHNSASGQLHAFQNKVQAQVTDLVLAMELIEGSGQVIEALGGDKSDNVAAKLHGLKWAQGGKMKLEFSGAPGQTFIVEASTNLVDWEPVGVASVDGDGSFEFQDTEAAKHRSRFYRVVELK